jgi:hypothetical protein
MRNPIEERQLLAEFAKWRKADPSAVVIVGTMARDTSGEDVQIDVGMLDFEPEHLMILSVELLRRAKERILAGGNPVLISGLLPFVAAAMAALTGEEDLVRQ